MQNVASTKNQYNRIEDEMKELDCYRRKLYKLLLVTPSTLESGT